jgi:hypothetical protein
MFSSLSAFSQKVTDPKNQIIGKWKTDDNRAIIEIDEQEGKYAIH